MTLGITRRPWLCAVLTTTFLSIPALAVGFVGDDLLQRLILEHRFPGSSNGWWRLYEFTPSSLPAPELVENGLLPWFTDPELRLRFFRPLTSATLAADAWCFGRNAALAHAHSVVWLLMLTAVSARLYERWFVPAPALLSALVFAVAGAHGMPTAWLCARHTLVAATLAVTSLWAWAKYREDQWRPGRWFAPVCLLGSLLASESAFCGVLFLVAHELGARGWRRPQAAVAYLVLGLAYISGYAATGHGAHGSGLYVSPFESPSRYLAAALVRVPILAAELLWAVPADAVGAGEHVRNALVGAGILAIVVYGACSYTLRTNLAACSKTQLWWLAAATAASLWALAGSAPTSRVLPLPLFGSAAIVGHGFWLLGQGSRRAPWPRRLVSLTLLLVFGTAQLVLSPLVRVQTARAFRAISIAQEQIALGAEVGRCSDQGYLYLLTGADPSVALYAWASLAFYSPEKAGAERVRVLSFAPHAQILRREATNVLELEVLADVPRRSPIEDMLHAPEHPLTPGSVVTLSELRIRVVDAAGGTWKRARLEARENLDNGQVCLLAWRAGRLPSRAHAGSG